MDNDLRTQIYNNMNLRETEDLIQIWQTNDREEWSELAFDVIREILTRRLGELPVQIGQSRKRAVVPTQISRKYAQNRFLVQVQYIYLASFALLLISKGLLPDAGGGWSNPPVFDYLFLLGLGVCFSTFCVVHTYFAWTLNAREYMEWSFDQVIIGKRWARKFGNIFPDWYILWSNRIIAPIGALMGIVVFSFVVLEIISS